LKVRADPWSAADRLRREFEAVGFFLSGHPLEAYDAALKRLRAKRWAEFVHAVRGGETSARLGASVIDRYERRTKTGNKLGVIQLSDPSGQYEAIIFQEGLGQYRDLLEKGADVLVTLQANVEGEDVRARIIQVESLTEAAAKVQKSLRVFVRDEAPLASIAERLRGRGEGEVSLIVMLGPKEGEVEIRLPGRYAVTGALAGALKAVAGVVAVEQV
jgi:DNA polymerase-3 subunit alpha